MNFWTCPRSGHDSLRGFMLGRTIHSGHCLFSMFQLESNACLNPQFIDKDKVACFDFTLAVAEGRSTRLDKRVGFHWELTDDVAAVWKRG